MSQRYLDLANQYLGQNGVRFFNQFSGPGDEGLVELLTEWLGFDTANKDVDAGKVAVAIYDHLDDLDHLKEREWEDKIGWAEWEESFPEGFEGDEEF